MSLVDTIPLEPEQQELLVVMVEAVRAVPRTERASFYFDHTMGGALLHHPGLVGLPEVHPPDVDILVRSGLVISRTIGRGSWELDVAPLGFRYYGEFMRRSHEPMRQVEEAVRRYLDADQFRTTYPTAYDKWIQAEEMLWANDSERALTTIGHLCREAVQTFATGLVERFKPESASPNPANTVDRVRAVLAQERVGWSETQGAFLDALLAYWGTVNDLIQRQEHGAQREGKPVVWEDARRVVFQTAVVMFEIAHAVH